MNLQLVPSKIEVAATAVIAAVIATSMLALLFASAAAECVETGEQKKSVSASATVAVDDQTVVDESESKTVSGSAEACIE